MTPAQLAAMTPDQLALLANYSVMLRTVASQFMKCMNQMNALNSAWNQSISGLVGKAAGTTIPDNTGLAGAAPLTDTDLINITSYFQGCMTSYYGAAYQQTMTKACGPGNTT